MNLKFNQLLFLGALLCFSVTQSQEVSRLQTVNNALKQALRQALEEQVAQNPFGNPFSSVVEEKPVTVEFQGEQVRTFLDKDAIKKETGEDTLTEAETAYHAQKLTKWKLVKDEHGYDAFVRDFEFNKFDDAWKFMSSIARLSKNMAHHPTWTNDYNKLSISLSTWHIGGLSGFDIIMARKIDNLYRKYENVDMGTIEFQGEQVRTFLDKDAVKKETGEDRLTEAETAYHAKKLTKWKLVKDEHGYDAFVRDFKFKDFDEAWIFMGKIAEISEKMGHHPTWTNDYNKLSISLSTWHIGGLSGFDIILARKIDKLYRWSLL